MTNLDSEFRECYYDGLPVNSDSGEPVTHHDLSDAWPREARAHVTYVGSQGPERKQVEMDLKFNGTLSNESFT